MAADLKSEKLSLTISEAMAVTGLGRTKLYEVINDGLLRARKLGRRTLILSSDLEEFLSDLEAIPPKNQEG